MHHVLTLVWTALVAQVDGSALDCYTNNPLEMHWCALSDITGSFGGQGLFALTVSGLVFIGGYQVTDGDLVLPSVVLMLIGGILIPSLPAQYMALGLTLMFAGGVAAVMQLLDRYVFSQTV